MKKTKQTLEKTKNQHATKTKKRKKPAGPRELFVPLYKKMAGKKISEYLTCEICGKEYKNLAHHVNKTHHLSLEEYRMDYPETEYFVSEEIRVLHSERSDGFLTSKRRMVKEAEITFVKENYYKMSIAEIAQALDLTRQAVNTIIKKCVPEKKVVERAWTEEEIEYVKAHYQEHSYREIGEALKRSVESITYQVQALGLRKADPVVPWAEEELRYLKKKYKKYTNQELAAYFGRHEDSVAFQLKRLNLRKVAERRAWTEEDDNYLCAHYKNKTNRELMEHFGCSQNALYYAMQRLGLSREIRWSKEQEAYIKQNHSHMTCKAMATELGCSVEAVRRKAAKLGLYRKTAALLHPNGAPTVNSNQGKLWTPEEEAYIKQHYQATPLEEMAAYLGRSPKSLYVRMMDMELLQNNSARTAKGFAHYWNDEDLRVLINFYMIMDSNDLCAILGRSWNGVKKQAQKMGLRKTHLW